MRMAISLATQDILNLIGWVDLEGEAGMPGSQRRQKVRKDLDGNDLARRNAHHAGELFPLRQCSAQQVAARRFHGFGDGKQVKRKPGRFQPGGGTREQRRLQPRLQGFEMTAYGRVRHPQGARRASQAARSDNGQERAPERPVHVDTDHNKNVQQMDAYRQFCSAPDGR
jgi:hypothetical protein